MMNSHESVPKTNGGFDAPEAADTVDAIDESAGQQIAEQLLREEDWERDRSRTLEDRAGRVIAAGIGILTLLVSVAKLDSNSVLRTARRGFLA